MLQDGSAISTAKTMYGRDGEGRKAMEFSAPMDHLGGPSAAGVQSGQSSVLKRLGHFGVWLGN
jgi:hypothetical protein